MAAMSTNGNDFFNMFFILLSYFQVVILFRSWFSIFSQSQVSQRQSSEFGEIPNDFSVVKVGSLPMVVTDYVANGSFQPKLATC